MRRVIRFSGLASAVFVTSWLLGRAMATSREPAVSAVQLTLPVGAPLPSGKVYADDGEMILVGDLIARHGYTALILMGTSCGSCMGEAIRWEELAQRHRDRVQFVAIANAPDRSYVSGARAHALVTVPIYRAMPSFPRTMGAAGLPTIYVTDSAGRVRFASTGTGATDELRVWLGASM